MRLFALNYRSQESLPLYPELFKVTIDGLSDVSGNALERITIHSEVTNSIIGHFALIHD